jgi:hypothetical protein
VSFILAFIKPLNYLQSVCGGKKVSVWQQSEVSRERAAKLLLNALGYFLVRLNYHETVEEAFRVGANKE